MQLEQWIAESVRSARGPKTNAVQRILKMDLKSQLILFGAAAVFLIILWPVLKLIPWITRLFLGVIGTLLTGGTRALTTNQISSLTFVGVFIVTFFFSYKFKTLIRGTIRGVSSGDTRALKEMVEGLRQPLPTDGEPRPEELAEAARQLSSFKPLDREAVQAVSQSAWLRLLVLAGAVDVIDGKLRKIVSVKSILEDREAGWDED
jgi:hypothetical protein